MPKTPKIIFTGDPAGYFAKATPAGEIKVSELFEKAPDYVKGGIYQHEVGHLNLGHNKLKRSQLSAAEKLQLEFAADSYAREQGSDILGSLDYALNTKQGSPHGNAVLKERIARQNQHIFQDRLDKHDWSHMMSDDPNTWRRGNTDLLDLKKSAANDSILNDMFNKREKDFWDSTHSFGQKNIQSNNPIPESKVSNKFSKLLTKRNALIAGGVAAGGLVLKSLLFNKEKWNPIEGLHPGSEGTGAWSVRGHSEFGSGYKGILEADLEEEIYADNIIKEEEYRKYIKKVKMAQDMEMSMMALKGASARKVLDDEIWWRNPGNINKVKAGFTERETFGSFGSYNSGSKELSIGAILNPNDVLDAVNKVTPQSNVLLGTLNNMNILGWISPNRAKETTLHEGLHAVWDLDIAKKDKELFYNTALEQLDREAKDVDMSTDVMNIAAKAPVYMNQAAKAHQTVRMGYKQDNPYVDWMANEMFAHRGALMAYGDLGYRMPENEALSDSVGSYIRWSKIKKRRTVKPGMQVADYRKVIDEETSMLDWMSAAANKSKPLQPANTRIQFDALHPGSQGMGAQSLRAHSEFGSGYTKGLKGVGLIRHISDLADSVNNMKIPEAVPKIEPTDPLDFMKNISKGYLYTFAAVLPVIAGLNVYNRDRTAEKRGNSIEGLHPGSQGMGAQSVRAHSAFGSGYQGQQKDVEHSGVSHWGAMSYATSGGYLAMKSPNMVSQARIGMGHLRGYMTFYHGTAEANANSILQQGIVPNTGDWNKYKNIAVLTSQDKMMKAQIGEKASRVFFSAKPWVARSHAAMNIAQGTGPSIQNMQSPIGQMTGYYNPAVRKGTDPGQIFKFRLPMDEVTPQAGLGVQYSAAYGSQTLPDGKTPVNMIGNLMSHNQQLTLPADPMIDLSIEGGVKPSSFEEMIPTRNGKILWNQARKLSDNSSFVASKANYLKAGIRFGMGALPLGIAFGLGYLSSVSNKASNSIEGLHPGSEGMGASSVRAHSAFGSGYQGQQKDVEHSGGSGIGVGFLDVGIVAGAAITGRDRFGARGAAVGAAMGAAWGGMVKGGQALLGEDNFGRSAFDAVTGGIGGSAFTSMIASSMMKGGTFEAAGRHVSKGFSNLVGKSTESFLKTNAGAGYLKSQGKTAAQATSDLTGFLDRTIDDPRGLFAVVQESGDILKDLGGYMVKGEGVGVKDRAVGGLLQSLTNPYVQGFLGSPKLAGAIKAEGMKPGFNRFYKKHLDDLGELTKEEASSIVSDDGVFNAGAFRSVTNNKFKAKTKGAGGDLEGEISKERTIMEESIQTPEGMVDYAKKIHEPEISRLAKEQDEMRDVFFSKRGKTQADRDEYYEKSERLMDLEIEKESQIRQVQFGSRHAPDKTRVGIRDAFEEQAEKQRQEYATSGGKVGEARANLDKLHAKSDLELETAMLDQSLGLKDISKRTYFNKNAEDLYYGATGGIALGVAAGLVGGGYNMAFGPSNQAVNSFEGLHPGSQGMGAQSIRKHSEFGSGYQGPKEQWKVEDEDVNFGFLRFGSMGIGLAAAGSVGYGFFMNKSILTARAGEDVLQRGNKSVVSQMAVDSMKAKAAAVKAHQTGEVPHIDPVGIFNKGERYLSELGYDKKLVRGGVGGLAVGGFLMGLGGLEIAGATMAAGLAGWQDETGEESQMRHEAAYALRNSGYKWMGIGALGAIGGAALITQASKTGESQFSGSTKMLSNLSLEKIPVKSGPVGEILNSLPEKVKQFKPFTRRTFMTSAAVMAGAGTLSLGHELLLNKQISSNRGSIAQRDFENYGYMEYMAGMAMGNLETAGGAALGLISMQRLGVLYSNGLEYVKTSGQEHLNYGQELLGRFKDDWIERNGSLAAKVKNVDVKGLASNKVGQIIAGIRSPQVLRAGAAGAVALTGANMLHQGLTREEINIGAGLSMAPSTMILGGMAGVGVNSLWNYHKELKATGSGLGTVIKGGFTNIAANAGANASALYNFGKEGIGYGYHTIKADFKAKSNAAGKSRSKALSYLKHGSSGLSFASSTTMGIGLAISAMGGLFGGESLMGTAHGESMGGMDTRMKEWGGPLVVAGLLGKTASEVGKGYVQFNVLQSGEDINIARPFQTDDMIKGMMKDDDQVYKALGKGADWFFDRHLKSQGKGNTAANIAEVVKGRKGLLLGLGLVGVSTLWEPSARKDLESNKALNPISGRDDDYNTIQGMRHGGFAEIERKKRTDFGSGAIFEAGLGKVSGAIGKVFKRKSVQSEIKSRGMGYSVQEIGTNDGFQGAGRLLAKDDAWNTIPGLNHGGFAQKVRKTFTDFGSGLQAGKALLRAAGKQADETLSFSSKDLDMAFGGLDDAFDSLDSALDTAFDALETTKSKVLSNRPTHSINSNEAIHKITSNKPINEVASSNDVTLYRGVSHGATEHYNIPEEYAKRSRGREQVERFLEEIRVEEFPHRPSRYESTYWTPDLRDASGFAVGNTSKWEGPIVSEIKRNKKDLFFGDQTQVSFVDSALTEAEHQGIPMTKGMWESARDKGRKYWKGIDYDDLVKNPDGWVVPEVLIPGTKRNPVIAEKAMSVERTWTKNSYDYIYGKKKNIQSNKAINPISGKDDAHNTIEALKHGGMAARIRERYTEFGSGYQGLEGTMSSRKSHKILGFEQGDITNSMKFGHLDKSSMIRSVMSIWGGAKEARNKRAGAIYERFRNGNGQKFSGMPNSGMSANMRASITDFKKEFASRWDMWGRMAMSAVDGAEDIAFREAREAAVQKGMLGESMFGKVMLMEGVYDGQKFQFARKVGEIGDNEVAAQIASSHNVAPSVYGTGLQGKEKFVDMEVFKGTEIGKMSLDDIKALEGEINKAVGSVHDTGFVHKDTHFGNFFVVENNGKKEIGMIDFGNAEKLGREGIEYDQRMVQEAMKRKAKQAEAGIVDEGIQYVEKADDPFAAAGGGDPFAAQFDAAQSAPTSPEKEAYVDMFASSESQSLASVASSLSKAGNKEEVHLQSMALAQNDAIKRNKRFNKLSESAVGAGLRSAAGAGKGHSNYGSTIKK